MSPNAYVAVALQEATSDSPADEPLYREDFVLVYAESEEAARRCDASWARRTVRLNEPGRVFTLRCKRVVNAARALR
ncbi:DUF4288 domain-containing protein [Amycolatopsis sp. NPDC004368]